MRQFVTPGFWLSLLALAALTLGALQIARDDDALADQLPPELVDETPPTQEIDIVALVFEAQAQPGFAIEDGVATADLQIRVDGLRYMNIRAGTPGENRCPALDQLAQCVVAADLLGEAVMWFSIVPLEPRNTVTLPAVAELRDDGRVRLVNGWLVRHARVVKRTCATETASLVDFIRTIGDASRSTYSLDEQALVAVTCTGEPSAP